MPLINFPYLISNYIYVTFQCIYKPIEAPNRDCGLSSAGQAVQLWCGFNSYKNVYIVYVEIFVTVNCGAGRDDGHRSKSEVNIQTH